jgi:hypothetical protein
MKYIPFFFLLLINLFVAAQKNTDIKFKLTLENSMFPDVVKGSNDNRYNDNSTLIYVPKNFDKTHAYQFFFWFHGWNNNIESTLEQFKLKEELSASGINAILVMPEAAKNAQDSYCGKWEKPNTFNAYFAELKKQLSNKNIIDDQQPSSMIIAGHSGASHVLVRLMVNANYHIKAVLLFDAISFKAAEITNFLIKSPTTKFINLYTSRPNTNGNSKSLMKNLDAKKVKYIQKNDTEFKADDVKLCNVFMLYTNLTLNDVATSNHYIQKFLKAIDF